MVNTDPNFKINPEYFNAFRFVDKNFKQSLRDVDVKDSKGMKVGKILGSQFNVGTAVIDMQRLYKNGVDAKYYIDGEKQVILWQPTWMKLLEAQQMQEEGTFPEQMPPD